MSKGIFSDHGIIIVIVISNSTSIFQTDSSQTIYLLRLH